MYQLDKESLKAYVRPGKAFIEAGE